MIQEDAARVLELHGKIKALEAKCEQIADRPKIAQLLDSLPGFGLVSICELAGEIGTVDRFRKEASLALCLGMSHLGSKSGKY